MPRPLGGDRPAVRSGDTALHRWLVAAITNRLIEQGWTQTDLREASGHGGNVSVMLRGGGGNLSTWQSLIDAAGVTLVEINGHRSSNLRAYLAYLVLGTGLTGREVARRADMSESAVTGMLAGRHGGTLVAWQRVLDAAGVTLDPVPVLTPRDAELAAARR